ncbi:MAG: transposase [Sphaerochaeta sp.]|jgi:putative transposase|nr:transposase [Sphaerochaeta sp.]
MDGNRARLDGYWLSLSRLDSAINMAEVLRFAGEVKSVVISKQAGYWYASFNVEVEPPQEYVHPHNSVGIDLGINTLAYLSNGQQFENQKLLRVEQRKLKRLNRELSRRQQGSNRWNRTKQKLARFHQRIANRRSDYIHKMTTEVARTYRIIGVEDLNVAGMVKNRYLALSISDCSFGEIDRQLAYKADWYGGEYIEIDRWYPSSKLCSSCGAIKSNLTLANRLFVCDCGLRKDRDWNAAINIESEALRTLAGVGSRRGKTDVDESVRPLAAVSCEASKMAEKGQPSESCQVGTVW